MTEPHWEVVAEVAGDLTAEMLKGLLEAQGIRVVWLSQEGAGKAYGLSIPAMGTVQLLVPSDQAEQAEQVLEAYNSGQYANQELVQDQTVKDVIAEEEEDGGVSLEDDV